MKSEGSVDNPQQHTLKQLITRHLWWLIDAQHPVPLEGANHGAWCSTVEGKCLFDLTYEFLIDRQGIET